MSETKKHEMEDVLSKSTGELASEAFRVERVKKWKITDNSDVVVEWNGVVLKGKIIFLRANDYEVKILEPYQDITHGLHVPYFAMYPTQYHWYTDKTGKLSEYGEQQVAASLVVIYVACKTVEENLTEIRQALEDCKAYSKREQRRKLMELLDEKYDIPSIFSARTAS